MKNKKTFFVIVAVLIVLLAGSYILYNNLKSQVPVDPLAGAGGTESQPAEEEEPELSPAPDFTVYDLEGNEVHLSDYIGKPIVLNFWASWCGPCQMEMPDFHEKYLEMGEDIQFLMINMTDGNRETVDIASSFVNEKGYGFPVFYDKDMDAASVYGAYSLPTTFFIDADGYVVANATGAIDAATLQKGIDMIYSPDNRPLIAQALGVEEDARNVSFILNSMDTVGMGQLQSAKLVDDNGDKILLVVAEDNTEYKIYLSANGNVDAIQNLSTGEWPIRSER